MKQKQIEARAYWSLETILNHPPSDLLDVYGLLAPHCFHKYDKVGHPIHIQLVGETHVDIMANFTVPDEVLASSAHDAVAALPPSHFPTSLDSKAVILTHAYDMETQCERARRQSAALGRPIERFVNIIDLQGMGMNHVSFLRFFRNISELDDVCYPERLHKTFVVNAPALFPSIWLLVKKFLSSKISDRVVVLGRNHSAELLECIDADSLPVQYGGSCNCPGGCVPSFSADHVSEAIRLYERKVGIVDIDVPKGQAVVHTAEIVAASERAPHKIAYSFRTLEHGISFAVEYAEKDSSGSVAVRVLRPLAKVDSAAGAVKGEFNVARNGQLRMIFDNESSWFRAKRVKLNLAITVPHVHASGTEA